MNVVVYGLQWGDEGKGKITTKLSKDFDFVVRYSGGSNAGHTVEYPSFKLVHHLIPSFDVRYDVKGYISNGVVVDLGVLRHEIEELMGRNVEVDGRLFISNLCHVVLPFHKLLDEKLELAKGSKAVGTTKRGIGPSYADKAHRIGVRLCDFEDENLLNEKLDFARKFYESVYGITSVSLDSVLEDYQFVSRFIVSPTEFRSKYRNASMLFEGTQGVLLDIDVGTYPYVTSSYCNTTGVEAGFGFPVTVDKRIGVFKAYTTRVGEGPFPTELRGPEGEALRSAGKEYGATTGRPRRCGWLDLPLLRYAVEVSGCDEMIITKADVLSGFDYVKVAVNYRLAGRRIDMPMNLEILPRVDVDYVQLPGWKSLVDSNFEGFLKFVESEVGCKITMISTGPGVDDLVER
ncbi:adenylosuccinate synthase [Fervidobacterium thailandense]|uniref:Adenylosuccinate synthetase n=1 Tax=Fervidobacterium thailandense TaxID=1008305 RepID=A0A1E3G1Q7_9BACT|nr:adenylosuccinate synthase [Fervidobacterium thailandense]ODN30080.1 adenylosuccinate synthetase [Fervidobacterium thailandense]